MRSIRPLFLLIFLGCACLISYALYLQLVKDLLPCPLCVVQRIAYWLMGLTGLLAFFHSSQAARRVYSGLMAIFAFLGMAVALRQAWLVRLSGSVRVRYQP